MYFAKFFRNKDTTVALAGVFMDFLYLKKWVFMAVVLFFENQS
jgi:hypothetical protein